MSAAGDELRSVAAALDRVPADSVDAVSAAFILTAERIGGRFGANERAPSGYQLTAKRSKVFTTAHGANMIFDGTPAGFWTVKSYGRRAVAPKRRRALETAPGRFAASARATNGDERWSQVVDAVDAEISDVVARVLDRKVR